MEQESYQEESWLKGAVSLGAGFKFFFVALLFSFGLAQLTTIELNKVLKKNFVAAKESANLKNVVASEPKMSFRKGIWPRFDVIIDELSFEKQWGCTKVDVQARGLRLSMLSVVFKGLKNSSLYFSDVDMGAVESDCERSDSTALKSQPVDETPKAKSLKTKNLIEKNLLVIPGLGTDKSMDERDLFEDKIYKIAQEILDWKSPKKKIGGLIFEKLHLSYNHFRGKGFEANGKLIGKLKDTLILTANFSSLLLKKKDRTIETELFFSTVLMFRENLLFSFNFKYREGGVSASYGASKGESGSLFVDIKSLPVSIVNNWLETDWSLQYLWLNCKLSYFHWNNKKQPRSWEVKDCGLSGGDGAIKLTQKEVSSFDHPEQLNFTIEGLNLDKIIQNKSELVLAQIFKEFGVLDGTLDYANGAWQLALKDTGSHLLFSSKRVRQSQLVEKLDVSATLKKRKLNVVLNDLKFEGGRFDGDVEMEYDFAKDFGVATFKVNELAFQSGIQLLMTNGIADGLRFKGELALGAGVRPVSWDGSFELEGYRGKEVSFTGLRSETNWKSGEGLSSELSMEQLAFTNQQRWYTATQLLAKDQGAPSLSISNLKVLLKGKVWSWELLEAQAGDRKVSSLGSYDSKSQEYSGGLRWVLAQGDIIWGFVKDENSQIKWRPKGGKLLKLLTENEESVTKIDDFEYEESTSE